MIWLGEVIVDVKFISYPHVFSELLSVVRSDCVKQFLVWTQRCNHHLRQTGGVLRRKRFKDAEVGHSVVGREYIPLVMSAVYQVDLKIPETAFLFDNRWTLINADLPRNGASSVLDRASFMASVSAQTSSLNL